MPLLPPGALAFELLLYAKRIEADRCAHPFIDQESVMSNRDWRRRPNSLSPVSPAGERTAAVNVNRRKVIGATAAASALALAGAPALVRAQSGPKIRIGYWPIAAGLPFFAAIEKGYFKEAGLDVEGLKFAGAQQVMEAMLSGRADGSANGTGSANLAIGEIAQPGLFKIFATNPSNAKYVLDEFIVAEGQPVQDDGRPEGQAHRVGPRHPERDAGQDDARDAPARRARQVIELPIGQHVAAIAAGQVDAVLHARADRHRRPHERHHARARGRRDRQIHPRRSAGAVARRLGAA